MKIRGDFHDVTANKFLSALQELNSARVDSASTRHKPLLLLFAMKQVAEGCQSGVHFRQAEEELRPVLESPLGVGHRTDVALPFFHLQSDGIWMVAGIEKARWRKDGKRPLTTELRRLDAVGLLPPAVMKRLESDPAYFSEAYQLLTEAYWGSRDRKKVADRLGLQAILRR